MTKYETFNYIQKKLDEGYDWNNILKFMVKDGKISRKVTAPNLLAFYNTMVGKKELDVLQTGDSKQLTVHENIISEYNKLIGRKPNSFKRAPDFAYSPIKDVILTLSDIHVPYHNKEMIVSILEKHKDEITKVVLNGDTMNGDKFSKHPKKQIDDFPNEMAETTALIELIRSYVPWIGIVDGNHCQDRFTRFLADVMPPEYHAHIPEPLSLVINGIDGVYRSKSIHSTEFKNEIGHTLIIGDALWSHLTFSGKDGESVRKVEKWYYDWRKVFFADEMESRVFIHGHTHQLGINYSFDKAVIQAGTLCKLDGLRYSMESHGKSTPPCYGYTIFEQNNGITDFESIRVIKLKGE